VAEISCEHANLAAVVRIVLDQISEHVYGAPGHSFHACLSRLKRGLEQAREILRRLLQRPSRLRLRHGVPIQ
jgi:selenocysteine lyase/cysteine desulfurase